jgi:hypothetical protein
MEAPSGDPCGYYDADTVTVAVDEQLVAKGDGSAGQFVFIGRSSSHFTTTSGADGSLVRNTIHDPRRPVQITLRRSAPGNTALRNMRNTGHGRVCIRQKDTGATLVDADGWVESDSPADIGVDERLWNLTVCFEQ